MGAWLSLAAIGVALGAAMLSVFGRVSNQAAIVRVKRRLQAHLYELRLFADEPALVWRAQAGLAASNLRYLGLMLVPALVLAVPLALLYPLLDAVYGLAPLPIGRPAMITVQMRGPMDPAAKPPTVEVPEGIVLETPALRMAADRQFCWRIRPVRAVRGMLRVGTLEKSIAAEPGAWCVSPRRVRSWLALPWYPVEKKLPPGPVDWIAIDYPPASVHGLGLDLPWPAWLLLFSMASALALKRAFAVSF